MKSRNSLPVLILLFSGSLAWSQATTTPATDGPNAVGEPNAATGATTTATPGTATGAAMTTVTPGTATGATATRVTPGTATNTELDSFRNDEPSVSFGQTDRTGVRDEANRTRAQQIPGIATTPDARQIPGLATGRAAGDVRQPANVATGMSDTLTTTQPNLAQRIRQEMLQNTTLAPVVSGISVIESGNTLSILGMVRSQEQMEEALDIARDFAPDNVSISNELQVQSAIE